MTNPDVFFRSGQVVVDRIDVETEETVDGIKVKLISTLRGMPEELARDDREDILKENIRKLKED